MKKRFSLTAMGACLAVLAATAFVPVASAPTATAAAPSAVASSATADASILTSAPAASALDYSMAATFPATFYPRVHYSCSLFSHIYDWWGWRDNASHGVDTAMSSCTFYFPSPNIWSKSKVVGKVTLCNGDNFWINDIPATIRMTNSVSTRYNGYRHAVLRLRPNTCASFYVIKYVPYVARSKWYTWTWQTWGGHSRQLLSGLRAYR